MDFSHVIIGGGVVGLAIAQRLTSASARSASALSRARNVLLVDRNRHIGMETSSRNSEVIHAGLYYPPDSLKTQLCIKGKQMLYDLFDDKGIKYKRCGKWIVAQDAGQAEYLSGLRSKADSLGVPTRWISSAEAKRVESCIKVDECALESSSTGIMDSHGLMQYLSAQFQEDGGALANLTTVQDIEHIPGRGYRVLTKTDDGEVFEVTTESVINAAGLFAVNIANLVLPEPVKGYFAKGQYYAYTGHPAPTRLVYPCPEPGLAGLGTHLTMDLAGQIRFGPDVEWIDDPSDYSLTEARLDDVYDAVKKFYPSLDREKLRVDYCGIRPKMTPAGSNSSDFVIRHEADQGLPGFVNLLGMESPGLTSCLAIAEHVEELLK